LDLFKKRHSIENYIKKLKDSNHLLSKINDNKKKEKLKLMTLNNISNYNYIIENYDIFFHKEIEEYISRYDKHIEQGKKMFLKLDNKLNVKDYYKQILDDIHSDPRNKNKCEWLFNSVEYIKESRIFKYDEKLKKNVKILGGNNKKTRNKKTRNKKMRNKKMRNKKTRKFTL
jgi:hypothetical protein